MLYMYDGASVNGRIFFPNRFSKNSRKKITIFFHRFPKTEEFFF